jgi:hypothetical protein
VSVQLERLPFEKPAPEGQPVRIVDIDMPFSSMVGFMIKWALAAVPAGIVLSILVMVMLYAFGHLALIGLIMASGH